MAYTKRPNINLFCSLLSFAVVFSSVYVWEKWERASQRVYFQCCVIEATADSTISKVNESFTTTNNNTESSDRIIEKKKAGE